MEYFRIPIPWTMTGLFWFVFFIVNQYELVFQSFNIFHGTLSLFLWAKSIIKHLGNNFQWQINMKNKLRTTKSILFLWVIHSAGVWNELLQDADTDLKNLDMSYDMFFLPLESSLVYPCCFQCALSALHSHETGWSLASGDFFFFQK